MSKKFRYKKKRISIIIIVGVIGFIGGTVIISENGQLNQVVHRGLDEENEEQADEVYVKELESQSTTAQSIRMTLKEVNANDILLVNKTCPLDKNYSVELKWLANGREQVAREIYDALEAMLSDGSDEGLRFVVASGYRSEDYQQKIWDDTIKMWKRQGMSEEEAVLEASKTLAYPGESEHATGLAVDIVSADYQLLDEQQHYTKESTWLRENCAKYGFILRYPMGKEDVTGITYESWHFRYVGKAVAKCIMENGITLEEYLAFANSINSKS